MSMESISLCSSAIARCSVKMIVHSWARLCQCMCKVVWSQGLGFFLPLSNRCRNLLQTALWCVNGSLVQFLQVGISLLSSVIYQQILMLPAPSVYYVCSKTQAACSYSDNYSSEQHIWLHCRSLHLRNSFIPHFYFCCSLLVQNSCWNLLITSIYSWQGKPLFGIMGKKSCLN